jgi:small neutral amino acid transporter SnatA (MarC family)
MDTFFALLTFASFIFLLIGIISPKASLFWLKGARNRTKSILIYRLALTGKIITVVANAIYLIMSIWTISVSGFTVVPGIYNFIEAHPPIKMQRQKF